MERELVIPIRAVTKGRPRLGRRRKAFTPPKTIQYEAAVAEAWRQAFPDEQPFDGPCGCRVVIMSNHIEVTVWELEEPSRPKYIQGDTDNYVKSILDALNTVAYVDDKQVHHFEAFLSKENPDEPSNSDT